MISELGARAGAASELTKRREIRQVAFVMASGSSNIFYKYESMRVKWSRCLEESNPKEADWIKNYFKYFYRNHRNFTFAVGELFDGTTHLLVKPSRYQQIKGEIEDEIEENLPEVAQVRNATIKRRRKLFPDFQSFKDCSKALKDENIEIERRRRREGKESVRKLRRTLSANPEALILAFDLEVYEHDNSIILEIGYVMIALDNPQEMQTFHYIIKENLRYANKDYVPDNRNRFKFGTSEHMSLRRAAAKIQEHIDGADFLVTHSGAHDAEFLANCGVSVSEKPMFDTQILAMALLPNGPLLYGLKRLMDDLDIQFDEDVLHNGGNDAFYTMKAFLALTEL